MMQTQDVVQKAFQLPDWLVYVGAIAGIIAVVFEIGKAAVAWVWRSKLEVRLTREVFFRVTSLWGEAAFFNIILMAKDGPVEVRDVSLTLAKTSGASKKYEMACMEIGEKVRSASGARADLHFFSSSPLAFVPQNVSYRLVAIAAIEEYGSKIKTIFRDFENALYGYRTELANTPDQGLSKRDSGEAIKEVKRIVGDYHQKLRSEIQLESGDYRLTVKCTFFPLKGFPKLKQVVESSVDLVVGQDLREIWDRMLNEALGAIAAGTVFGEKVEYVFPEYTPVSVMER